MVASTEENTFFFSGASAAPARSTQPKLNSRNANPAFFVSIIPPEI
jgi:hypothetical protein